MESNNYHRLKCPNCRSDQAKEEFNDWQNNRYVVCSQCSCWYQKNINNVQYEEQYWGVIVDPDGKKRDLTLERDFKLKNWYGKASQFVNGLTPGRILDVGCGLGFFLSSIDDNWEKHGLEISENATDFIKNNFSKIKCYNQLIEDLSPMIGQFDVIMCYHVIEHVLDPVDFIKRLSSFLKKDGYLIIGTPNVSSFVAKRFKSKFRLLGNGHICLFTKKSLKNLVIQNGFKIIDIEFPFFNTIYFSFKNLLRLLDISQLSPPFYGNVMTFYLKKI